MNDFLARHQRLLASTAYLVAGLLAAVWSLSLDPMLAWNSHLAGATQTIERENKAIEEKQKKQLAQLAVERAGKGPGTVISSLPDFLRHINSVANTSGVKIRKLTPDETNKLRYTLEIVEDYERFLKFASRLESLNVSIHDIAVHPYDLRGSPPRHAIAFSLTPRDNAKPLEAPRLDELKGEVAKTDKRNPFQRFTTGAGKGRAVPEIDLTWIYRMTGIGRVGQTRYATIDSKDYKEGDEMEGMTITKIDSEIVRLTKTTATGTEKYQLKFRRGKSPQTQGTKG